MRRETLLFRAAVALLMLHALDDAVAHRQPGVGVEQHLPAAVFALACGAVALAVFGRLRPGLRSGLAAMLGTLGLVNGAMHVGHVRADALGASDLTGVAAALAGVALVALAAAIPFRHRGTGAATAWARGRNRVVAAAAAFAGLLVLAPVSLGIVDSHKWREPIPATPAGYEAVTFRSADGLLLRGWQHPSQNGATILVAHGGNGDRTGAMAHARMLVGHGYGVLVYDARGRGESEGTQSGYGWGLAADVDGALDFLEAQPGVDRIGAFGLSTGADIVLEAAPDHPEVGAVVTDGAAGMTYQDGQRLNTGSPVEDALARVMFATVDVLTGAEQPRVIEDRVAALRAPLLLISAPAQGLEHDFNVLYEAAAAGHVEHWNLPRSSHTRGLRDEPAAYERRVVAFLDSTLLAAASTPETAVSQRRARSTFGPSGASATVSD
jgi:dienelactone hydrolase